MAKLAIVEGVKLFMYSNDHGPPHFHALSAEHHAVIDLEDLTMTRGHLPRVKLRAVLAWAKPRRALLLEAWSLTQAHLPAGRIE
jgi:hypothetical protein